MRQGTRLRHCREVVAILALNGDVNLEAFLDQFAVAAGVGGSGAGAAAKAMAAAPNVPYTFNVERHRQGRHVSPTSSYQCSPHHSPHSVPVLATSPAT